MIRRRTIVCVATMLALLTVGLRVEVASANIFRSCHDDSRLPHTWNEHGNPNRGLPGDSDAGHGYYYLAIRSGCAGGPRTGRHLVGTVKLTGIVRGRLDSDGMCWRLDITSHYHSSRKLVMAVIMGTSASITYTHGVLGGTYRFRVANMEQGVTVTDHSTFDG